MTTQRKRAKARKKQVKRLKLLIRTAHEKRITDAAYLRGFIDSAMLAAAGFARAAAAFAPLHPDTLHRRRVERALEMGFPAVPMKRPGFAVGGHRPSGGVMDDVVDAVAFATESALHRSPKVWAYEVKPGEPWVKPTGSPVDLRPIVKQGRETVLGRRLAEIRAKLSPEAFRREVLNEPAPVKPPVCTRCNDAGEVVDSNAIPMSHREPLKYKPCPDCVFAGRVIVVPRGSGKCGMGCGCFNQCELKNPKASTLPANARVFIRDEYR